MCVMTAGIVLLWSSWANAEPNKEAYELQVRCR